MSQGLQDTDPSLGPRLRLGTQWTRPSLCPGDAHASLVSSAGSPPQLPWAPTHPSEPHSGHSAPPGLPGAPGGLLSLLPTPAGPAATSG